MPKKPEHHGKPWTDKQVQQLEKLVDQNTPTRVDRSQTRTDGRLDPVQGKRRGHLAQADKSITLQPAQEMRR